MNEINAIFKYKPNINYCTRDLEEHSDPFNSSSVMVYFGENGSFVKSEFDNISGENHIRPAKWPHDGDNWAP